MTRAYKTVFRLDPPAIRKIFFRTKEKKNKEKPTFKYFQIFHYINLHFYNCRRVCRIDCQSHNVLCEKWAKWKY